MTCKQAELTMALHIANDPDMPEGRRLAFERHLKNCPKCLKEYQESKYVIELVKQHWQVSEETLDLIIEAGKSYKPKMTVEEGWKDLCRRCPDLAESTKKPKSLQLFLRISAVAACIVIGILTWTTFTNHSKQQILSQDIVFPQVAAAPEASVRVELVKSSGNIAIGTDRPIVADNELKTLLINYKHHMVMNTGTILTIEPTVKYSNIGCLVKLTSGRVYARVEHDGSPFVVETFNGKAVITGTTFTVKTESNSTTLIVTEGTVRFASEKGEVNVGAGQLSEIVNKLAPTKPTKCNTAKLTAWATDYEPEPPIVQVDADDMDWYLTLSLRKDPIVLAETNYSYWVNEKRGWFKTNFPWIFELKDALVKEGIEIDYPELLIQSGDVWQFVCLQKFPGRFSVPDFESLLKTATSYEFDKEWLLENVPIVGLIQDKSLLSENLTGLDALDQLLKYADGIEVMPYYLYPADAGRYLAETRSLIWFAINAGEFNLTDEQQTEVLDSLQQEVIIATNCCNDLLYPEDEEKKSLCDEDLCETTEAKILKHMEVTKLIEEKVTKYKISK